MDTKSVEIPVKPMEIKKGEEADFEVFSILNGKLDDLDLVFTVDGTESVVCEEAFETDYNE